MLQFFRMIADSFGMMIDGIVYILTDALPSFIMLVNQSAARMPEFLQGFFVAGIFACILMFIIRMF